MPSAVVENPRVDERGATFQWLGAAPPPIVVGSWCNWDPERGLTMRRTGHRWEARVELQADAYVEYGLLRDGSPVPDPLNVDRVDNGYDGRNQRFWMPKARRRAIALTRRRVPRGEVTLARVNLGWLASPPLERRFALYLPHAATADVGLRRELPLLLVLDGLDYLRRGKLPRLLDALIADGSIAPVAAAFLDNAGPGRSNEYAANDFTLSTLADIAVPAAVERLGLAPQRVPGGAGRAAIIGSSLGGLMALHSGVRRPDVFGRVVAQSTSVLADEVDIGFTILPAMRLTLLDLIEAAPAPPSRFWLDVGDLEDLAASNDRLAAMLTRRGFGLAYRRFPGGHDHTSWAESLVDALPAMFPPAV